MRRALLLVLALVVTTTSSARAARVTITRATLDATGQSRLAEAIARVAPWLNTTSDFYTYSPTPGGATMPRALSWSVVLDGAPVDVSVFDAMHLELVPVAVGEIDSIVFVSAEDGLDGSSARGRIELYTTRAGSGWSVDAALAAASQSGDPGPYAYTAQATPNVDAIGPDAALRIAHGSRNWYASLSGRLAQHPFTDTEIRERVDAQMGALRPGVESLPPNPDLTSWFYNADGPAVLRTSATLRAGVRSGSHWHDATLALSDAHHYFHFSEAFGSEVPTDQMLSLASLSGAFATGARTRIEYSASASEKELRDTDGALAFDYEWESRHAGGNARVVHETGRTRAHLGAGIEQRTVSSTDTLTDDSDTFVRANAGVERRVSRSFTLGASLASTFADDDNAIAGGVTSRWVVRDADTLSARVVYRQRLAVEDDNLWLWTARGYSMLADRGLAPTYENTTARSGVGTVEVAWSSLGMLGGIRVAGAINRFDDATVERRSYAFEPAACAFESPTRVIGGQQGHTGMLDLRVWHGLGDHSRADFSFVYLEEFNSDADFSAVWRSVPRHQIRYALSFWPLPTWSGRVAVTHVSSTHWVDYETIDGVVCLSDGFEIPIRARVDGVTSLDASIRHGMFGGRWVADVIARNILDDDVRYHPAGASMSFTLIVQLRTNWN